MMVSKYFDAKDFWFNMCLICVEKNLLLFRVIYKFLNVRNFVTLVRRLFIFGLRKYDIVFWKRNNSTVETFVYNTNYDNW